MAIWRLIIRCFAVFLGLIVSVHAAAKPNIIIILADDLGWNDVGFHGSSQIPTPNIDALAYHGIILNSHYVPALCTPSRSSLMTGKYPTHTGMQHLVILAPEPWGLPLSETLMPEYLKAAGYATHAVGKWHLGFHRKEYTPTYRGFDSHYGYWNGYQDYYDHTMSATPVPYKGYDMRRNMTVDWLSRGQYSTDLFTNEAVHIIETHDSDKEPLFLYLAHLAPHTGNPEEPFQAPDEEVAKFAHIDDPERRMYAAMVSKLDQSVGDVMLALRKKGMLHNSIVLFMSDNGAPTFGVHSNRGSNFPLRGMKESPWEGGVRGVAAVWSPLLHSTQRVSNQLMHIADWLPTFYAAAGLDVRELGNIDGIDMWKALSENQPSPRIEVLHNIDPIEDYAALRRGDWKYVTGTAQDGKIDEWYGESSRGSENKSLRYNVQEVLNSKVGVAITGFITKQQLQAKALARMVENGSSDKGDGNFKKLKLLSEVTVTSLRHQAEVHCNKKKGISVSNESSETACWPREAPCLFNIHDDPCETKNLAHAWPLVLLSLEESLERYKKTMVNPLNVPGDPMSNPIYWNDTWDNWKEDIISPDASITVLPRPANPVTASLMTAISLIIALCIFAVAVKMSVNSTPQKSSFFSRLFIKAKDVDISGNQKGVVQ